MADFRRWITVLAVLAVFAGLASAQIGTGTQQQNPAVCFTQTVTPQIRSEGYTEETGDIVITCTGGPVTAPGTQISQANIVVNLNAPVTSRLLSGSNTEALLLIDEPGSGLIGPVVGFGPSAPQVICTTANQGCIEYAYVPPTGNPGGTAVSVGTSTGTTPGPNVFQGVLTGNQQITFYGVPILPPATTGVSRVFRITNIRVNANFLGSGQATAAISTNGSTSLPINQSSLTVGFVQNSLKTSVSSPTSWQQCYSVNKQPAAVVGFTELFATAFKTRVMPLSNTTNGSQGTNTAAPVNQNIPGSLYFSESNFIQPAVANSTFTAGLADFGTRLKAVFNNVPTGTTVYVTANNIQANGAYLTTGPPAVVGGTSTIAYSQLVVGETQSDSPSFPANTSGQVNVGSTAAPINIVPLTVTNGTAVAVWEMVNDNPNSIDSVYFGVYISFTSNTANNIPPAPSSATVNLSYAPTPTQGAFTAAAGGAASSSLPIPRFTDTSTASTWMTINLCQTALLWPFATGVPGFDTGLAVANTSTDPFSQGTNAQHGTCTLNFYGSTTTATGTGPAPAAFTTPDVPTATVWASNLSTIAPGFQGYVIGVCNFQYAHGYAAVTDTGVRNFLGNYLALIMNNYTVILPSRGFAAETWEH